MRLCYLLEGVIAWKVTKRGRNIWHKVESSEGDESESLKQHDLTKLTCMLNASQGSPKFSFWVAKQTISSKHQEYTW